MNLQLFARSSQNGGWRQPQMMLSASSSAPVPAQTSSATMFFQWIIQVGLVMPAPSVQRIIQGQANPSGSYKLSEEWQKSSRVFKHGNTRFEAQKKSFTSCDAPSQHHIYRWTHRDSATHSRLPNLATKNTKRCCSRVQQTLIPLRTVFLAANYWPPSVSTQTSKTSQEKKKRVNGDPVFTCAFSKPLTADILQFHCLPTRLKPISRNSKTAYSWWIQINRTLLVVAVLQLLQGNIRSNGLVSTILPV